MKIKKFKKHFKFYKIYQILKLTTFILLSTIIISSHILVAEEEIEHPDYVQISDSSPTVGDTVTISGEIKNANYTIKELIFKLELFWDYDKDGIPDNNDSYVIEKEHDYVSIGPNESHPYDFTWKTGIAEEPKEDALTGNFFILVDIDCVVESEDSNDTKVVNVAGVTKSFTIKEKEKGLCILSTIAVIPVFSIIYRYRGKKI